MQTVFRTYKVMSAVSGRQQVQRVEKHDQRLFCSAAWQHLLEMRAQRWQLQKSQIFMLLHFLLAGLQWHGHGKNYSKLHSHLVWNVVDVLIVVDWDLFAQWRQHRDEGGRVGRRSHEAQRHHNVLSWTILHPQATLHNKAEPMVHWNLIRKGVCGFIKCQEREVICTEHLFQLIQLLQGSFETQQWKKHFCVRNGQAIWLVWTYRAECLGEETGFATTSLSVQHERFAVLPWVTCQVLLYAPNLYFATLRTKEIKNTSCSIMYAQKHHKNRPNCFPDRNPHCHFTITFFGISILFLSYAVLWNVAWNGGVHFSCRKNTAQVLTGKASAESAEMASNCHGVWQWCCGTFLAEVYLRKATKLLCARKSCSTGDFWPKPRLIPTLKTRILFLQVCKCWSCSA